MSTVTLEINGKKVNAESGQTVLQAARVAGIDIPTLCYHQELKSSGNCRLCMVEVKKGARTNLVAACCYPVEEGLTVNTETPRLVKNRKLILELIWPTAADIAKKLGVNGTRFDVDMPDCNLCGLCVRYCQEHVKKNVLYFKGRGTTRQVAFVPGESSECTSCRQCFGMCSGGFVVTSWADADNA